MAAQPKIQKGTTMKITATPDGHLSASVKVRLDLEGVPDMKATPTITVRPDLLTINYTWYGSGSGWRGHASLYGLRVLKSGELSDSRHQIYRDALPWIKHVIKAYTPKHAPEVETEPMTSWDAQD